MVNSTSKFKGAICASFFSFLFFAPSAAENTISTPLALEYSNYLGTSFTANWEPVQNADFYTLNVYSIGGSFNEAKETFNGDYLKDGWIVNVQEDKLGDGRLCLSSNGDYIITPSYDGGITEVEINATLLNADDVDNTSTTTISIELFDSQNNRIISGSTYTAAFRGGYSLSLKNAFYAIPENYDHAKITLGKSGDDIKGDLVVNSITTYYEGNDYIVKNQDVMNSTSFDVVNADGNKTYYYYVTATSGNVVSDKSNIVKVDGFMAPEATDPNDVTSKSYTANWNEGFKAAKYEVKNYEVNQLKEQGEADILNDDFSLAVDGTMTSPKSVNNLDLYTKTAGWGGQLMLVADGMIGADNGAMRYPGFLTTPSLDLAGIDGKYTITIKAYGSEGDYLSLYRKDYIVDGQLNIHATAAFPASGYIEETWEMEDGVDGMVISIEPRKLKRFFIDEITISQVKPEGYVAKNLVQTGIVEGQSNTSFTFENLDSSKQYGYEVRSIRYDYYGYEEKSDASNFKIVSLPSKVDVVESSDARVSMANGELHVMLTKDANITVYNIAGTKLAQCEGRVGDNPICVDGNAFIIVKVGNKAYKVTSLK